MTHRCAGILLIVPLAVAAATGRGGFDRQVVALPVESPTWLWPYWVDVDGDGRTDVLVVALNDSCVYIYHQEPSGFGDRPGEVVALPPGTAWFALQDVDRRPGLELVVSGPEGLAYFRQADRRFEPGLQRMLEAEQVFDRRDEIVPSYLGAPSERRKELPVMVKDSTILYEITTGSGITAGRRIELEMTHEVHGLDRDVWALGGHSARGFRIETTARERSEVKAVTPDEDALRPWRDRLEQEDPWGGVRSEVQDINRDGRQDVVLWAITGGVDAITKAAMFLRTERGTLPEKPTQILRLRGVPVSRGRGRWSLLHDVDGDGRWELVLLLLKAERMSFTTIFEAYVTQGLDVVMEIRCLEDGDRYSHQPTAGVEFTVMLPAFGMREDAPLAFFDGDFNGDTCRDVIVRRSPTHILIFLSAPAERSFRRRPAIAVDIPFAGETIMDDLNGDGRSDITIIDQENGRIAFMLSQPAGREEVHR